MQPGGLRQVDAPHNPALIRGACRSLHALAAREIGIDPAWALALDFSRFSAHAPFHPEAALARRIGWYLTITGFNVPAATLARVMGESKQVVSRHAAQVEGERDRAETAAVLARLEAIAGVGL